MANLFQNPEAEESVIGLILNNEAYWKLIPQITENDLTVPEFKMILKAMKQLYAEKKPIDYVTVNSELKKTTPKENQTAINAAMLGAGKNTFLAEYHLQEHISMLHEAALRRDMLSVIDNTRRMLVETDDDTASVLDRTRQSLRNLIMTSHSWETLSEVLLATIEEIGRRAKGEENGMLSGIADYDYRTRGLHRGECTVVGARPGVGKSAFAAQIALGVARKGYKVGICSREMTDIQYGTRVISNESGVSGDHIRSGRLEQEEWEAIARTLGNMSLLPVSFIFSTQYIEDLRMEVQRRVDAGDLDVLIVDYTQLMQTKQRYDKDYLRIGQVSKMLKDMSTDFNIAVIGLAQVSRSTEDSVPALSDLRGSGDLEQDADNVVFLHRPSSSTDKCIPPDDRKIYEMLQGNQLQYIVVNIAKQRQGDTGSFALVFDPARMRFLSVDRNK